MRLTRFEQRGNRHGHGQIGFAGAGGTYAEDQVVAFDGVHIAALGDGLRRDGFLAEIALPPAFHQTAQGGFRVGGDHAQKAVQIAVVEDVAFAHQRAVVGKNVGGARDAVVFAFDFQQSLSRRVRTFNPIRSAGYSHRGSRTGIQCRG